MKTPTTGSDFFEGNGVSVGGRCTVGSMSTERFTYLPSGKVSKNVFPGFCTLENISGTFNILRMIIFKSNNYFCSKFSKNYIRTVLFTDLRFHYNTEIIICHRAYIHEKSVRLFGSPHHCLYDD